MTLWSAIKLLFDLISLKKVSIYKQTILGVPSVDEMRCCECDTLDVIMAEIQRLRAGVICQKIVRIVIRSINSQVIVAGR